MAVAYFIKSGTPSVSVYFEHGMLPSVPVTPYRPQSIGVAEDQKIKVYDHAMAGTYKRKWKLKAVMTNTADTNWRFSDFITFVESVVVQSKYKFVYHDNDDNAFTVRLMNYSYEIIQAGTWEVTINLEEDYS